MKLFQPCLTHMQNHTITMNSPEGYPSNTYPNSDDYGYHDFYELEFFCEGEGLHYLNAIPYQVKPGYMYLLFPGDYHRMQLNPDKKFFLHNLKFTISASNPDLMHEIRQHPGPYCVYLDSEIVYLLEQEFQLLNACINEKKYNQRLAPNIVERICLLMLEVLRDNAAIESAPLDRRIFLITDYIEKNHTRDISFSVLAGHAGLSENYLGIFFKKHTGQKLTEYINQRRIYHAIQLLGSTDMSIKEVAYHTGFSSPEYMSRIFKIHHFSPPKTYQQK